MLRLFVENTELSDATACVRWCVDKSTLDELKSYGVFNPRLLISIIRGMTEVTRIIVPLEQTLAYIQFHRAGRHTLNAVIIWVSPEQRNFSDGYLLREFFLRKAYRSMDSFIHQIYSPAHSEVFEPVQVDYHMADLADSSEQKIRVLSTDTASLDINVGAEFFAAEPPEWEKNWVNLWFEQPACDQCQYRKRRFVAYTIQPPFVALYVIFFTFWRAMYAGFLLFLGRRNVRLSYLFHPWGRKMGDIKGDWMRTDRFWSPENDFFSTDSDGNDRPPFFFLLRPIILVLLAGLVTLILLTREYLGLSFTALCIIVVLASCPALAAFTFYLLSNLYKKNQEKRSATRDMKYVARRNAKNAMRVEKEKRNREKLDRAQAQRYETDLQDVVCCASSTPPPVRLDALPERRRTIYLRFQDLKARVCRPYARG